MSTDVWTEVAGPGPDEAALVVLVHGSMDRSAGLLRLSRRLDHDHRVVRCDRRGYGRSTAVGPPWTVAANIDDLERLVATDVAQRTSVDVPSPAVVVVGHSFGGNVALGLAARRPDLVDGVVVYETPMSWRSDWPGTTAGAAAMDADDAADAAEAFIRRLAGDDAWDRLPPAKQAQRRQEGVAMVAELADLRLHAPWQPEQIGVPVLALHGEFGRDHHIAAMRGLADLLEDCTVAQVDGAGHPGPHTHADAVAAPIREFIGERCASVR